MAEERRDRFTEVEARYAGYQVDDLFLDERDETGR